MIMNRFDLGGCCLARYGTASPYFASKTDQIMSRYRPIAPKPVPQITGGVVEAVQQPPLESSRTRTCNRSRKRSWDTAAGGVSSSPSPRGQKRTARCRGGHVSEVPRHHQQSRGSVVLPTSSVRPQSDTSDDGVSTLCEISDSAGTCTGSMTFGVGPRTSLGYSASSCTSFDSTFAAHKNEGLLEKDAAFMQRAAASASPNVNLPERRSQALISSERVPRISSSAMLQHQGGPPLQHQKHDIVTLPLLPIAPYLKESSSTSMRENRGMQSAFEDDCIKQPDLRLSNKVAVRSPCPVVDISVVEHLYSAASDPLILTDDSYSPRAIWYNRAYKKLMSVAASEVGIPKPLATFTLHNQPSTAILWGFPGLGQDRQLPSPAKNGVIMPQAVRPVGSSVVVECITETHLQEGMSMNMGMEEVEEELESKISPCLISDSQKRVRWANSAYKQMVGQPECSWLDRERERENNSHKVARIQGRVVLVLNSLQLPQGVAAFSCRVKIQWSNAADKTSITVPCDVVRINANGGSSYAWHFDIQAALCL